MNDFCLVAVEDGMAIRWFTRASSGPLAMSPDAFTEVEQASLSAILAFASNPANADRELMHCLNADGTTKHDISTGVKAAELTDVMKAAVEGGCGVRFWHNHPSGQSLSHTDWHCAAVNPTVEVLALSTHGAIFVGRVVEWDDAYQAVIEILSRIATDLEFKVTRICAVEHVDFDLRSALDKVSGHLLNLAIAEVGIGRYAYKLSASDQCVIDQAMALNIVQRAVAFGVSEIRSVIAEARATPASTSGS